MSPRIIKGTARRAWNRIVQAITANAQHNPQPRAALHRHQLRLPLAHADLSQTRVLNDAETREVMRMSGMGRL